MSCKLLPLSLFLDSLSRCPILIDLLQYANCRGCLLHWWLCISANCHAPARLAPVPELQSLGWNVRFRESKSTSITSICIMSAPQKIQIWQFRCAYTTPDFAVGLRFIPAGLDSKPHPINIFILSFWHRLPLCLPSC